MPEFLVGGAISEAIKRVLGGRDVRCAVAFWGEGAAEFIVGSGTKLEDVRILCDIDLGATSPRALRALGAPTNADLREHPRLHAKVYISDLGAVVGSANMSANGLGFGKKIGLEEAAVFLEPNSSSAHAAADWFDRMYKPAPVIGKEALRRAEKKYRPPRAMIPLAPVRTGSLLDLVVADPVGFGNLGFVLCNSQSTEAEIKKAKRTMKKEFASRSEEIDDWDDSRMFIGWTEDAPTWPSVCVEFFIPNKALKVSYHSLAMRDIDRGNILTYNGKPAAREEIMVKLPSAASIQKSDTDMVKLLLGDKDGLIFRSAHDLRDAIIAVSSTNSA